MKNLRGRITSYAFDRIRKEVISMKNDALRPGHVSHIDSETGKCLCVLRRAYRLPCKHKLREQTGPIPLASVHKRWHILYQNGRVATIAEVTEANSASRQESTDNSSSLLEVQMQQLHTLTKDLKTQQEKLNLSEELDNLFEKYKNNTQIDSMLMPTIVYSTKGRPKNTNREKVALERSYDSIKKLQRQEKAIKKEISQKSQQATGIPIPNGLSTKQVVGHFNPLPDGNCGFRALAHAILGDEEQYKLLKAKMIAFLNEKNVFYQQIFGSSQSSKPSPGTFESIMNKLYNEASLDSRDNWFQSPEMVQLAADTFSRAIACYTPDQQNTTFDPYFSAPSPIRPILLQLHGSSRRHFHLIETKPNSRPRWPPTFPGHSANCSSNLFTDYSVLCNN